MTAQNDGNLLEISSLLQIKAEVTRRQSEVLPLGLPSLGHLTANACWKSFEFKRHFV